MTPTSRALTLVVLGLVVGCRGRRAEREPALTVPTDGESRSALARAVDAAPGRAVDAPPTVREHMADHYGAVVRLEQALVLGRLDQARAEATYLIEHPEPAALAEEQAYVDAMRAAAGEVVAAPDLARAARHTATLGLQCSGCHTARSAIVTFDWEPLAADDRTLPVRMERHQWAARRLWEGLIAPSDDLWSAGASVLAGPDLEGIMTARGPAIAGAVELIARTRALAGKAATATSLDARAALYGDLLPACTGCHQLVRDQRPLPAPPP